MDDPTKPMDPVAPATDTPTPPPTPPVATSDSVPSTTTSSDDVADVKLPGEAEGTKEAAMPTATPAEETPVADATTSAAPKATPVEEKPVV